MHINIFGPFNGVVKFTDVNVSENSFEINAIIVDIPGFSHPDAGEITFKGFLRIIVQFSQ